jgi:tRNA dimethylallyltransferase
MSKMGGWLIGGPTGSGKSALALRLALEHGGEIVNADSMQVYRDLRILTARPTEEEEAVIPHHLFGVVDAAEAWSVGHWLTAAQMVLADIAARGRPAIVVGGTGLYFRALTRGLADIPPIPARTRAESQAMLERLGETTFRERLAAVDPAAARRIAVGDGQRLSRAWEVHAATGRALSDWQADTARPEPVSWRRLVLDPERASLNDRLDARLDRMVASGALHEVAALVARDLAPTTPAMKALGVTPFAAHLRGETSLADALALAQRDTRRYAKRQATWFRHQAPDWKWVDGLSAGSEQRQP